jgi:hypothetical protein
VKLLTPLQAAQIECEKALHKLEKLFNPECRLTLIMRTPGHPEEWILMTRDNLDELIADLPRMAGAEVTGIRPGESVLTQKALP